jgi:hypothetical protein
MNGSQLTTSVLTFLPNLWHYGVNAKINLLAD